MNLYFPNNKGFDKAVLICSGRRGILWKFRFRRFCWLVEFEIVIVIGLAGEYEF